MTITFSRPSGKQRPIVAIHSDSQGENGVVQGTATATYQSDRAATAALPAVTMGRIDCPMHLNFGFSAQSVRLGERIQPILDSEANTVLMMASNNFLLADAAAVNLQRFKDCYSEWLDRFLKAGRKVWLTTPFNKQQATQQARDILIDAQRWVMQQKGRHENLQVFNLFPAMVNPLSTDYNFRSGYSPDALHMYSLAWLNAQQPLVDYINSEFPIGEAACVSAVDLFTANNPRGNLNANGILDGTSGNTTGSASVVISGSNIPTGWSFQGVPGAGGDLSGLTATISVGTAPDGRPEFIIAFTGAFTGSASGSIIRLINNSLDLSKFAIGDMVQAGGDMALESHTTGCIAGLGLVARATMPVIGQQTVIDGYATPSDTLPSAISFRRKTPLYKRDGRTPALGIVAAPTAADTWFAIYLKSGAQTASGTVRLRGAYLGKNQPGL